MWEIHPWPTLTFNKDAIVMWGSTCLSDSRRRVHLFSVCRSPIDFFFSLTIDAIFYFYLRWLQTYRQIVSVVKASCLLFLFADLVFFFICNIWHKCNAKCYTEGKNFEFYFENSSQCIFFPISTSAFDFNSSCSSIHSSSLLWCDINNDDDDDDWIWEWIVVWETKMEVENVILIITK